MGLAAFAVAPLADAMPTTPATPADDSSSAPDAPRTTPAAPSDSTTPAPSSSSSATPTPTPPAANAPKASIDAVTPDFGFQKIRVGVQVKSGAWVPPGTTTAGSTVSIEVTGPNSETEASVNGSECQTQAGTEQPGSTETFCQFGEVNPQARAKAIAKVAAKMGITVSPADLSISNDYLAFPGDTVTFTQTTVNDGLVIDDVPQTVDPCVVPPPPPPSAQPAAAPAADSPTCPGEGEFVPVTFNDPGLPPTAVDDSGTAISGQPKSLDVVSNDETHGAPETITAVTQPAHGTVSVIPFVAGAARTAARPNLVANPTDEVQFTSDAGFFGTTTFTYTLTTPNGSSIATVTVDVLLPPTAVDDSATTPENQAVAVHVTANDSSNGAGAITLDSATDPAHGSVTINGSDVTYTPDQDFVGTDTFDYQISTPGGTAQATVTITVNAHQVLGETGQDSESLLLIALGLLASGGVVVAAARRRVVPVEAHD